MDDKLVDLFQSRLENNSNVELYNSASSEFQDVPKIESIKTESLLILSEF